MLYPLKIYPGLTSAVTGIDVAIGRGLGGMELTYRVSGDIAALRLPPFAQSTRTDELWKHTCFEVFIRPMPGDGYSEFNFSPSTQWAAYGFSGTRAGMHNIDIKLRRIEAEQEAQLYTLAVALDLTPLSSAVTGTPWRVNLSAVIEETSGRKSYWALMHPADKPDFHNPDCFTLELPAA